jgi:predicted transcriptional regulator
MPEQPDPPEGRPEVIAMLTSPETHQQMFVADVIMGLDEQTGNEFLVFGRGLLNEIVERNTEARAKIITLHINQATSELECLIAAVQTVKGWDEYEESQQ